MTKGTLLGELVTEEEVLAVPTPDPTATHYPISHGSLIDAVQSVLSSRGYSIDQAQYCLTHGGERFFGMFDLVSNFDNRGTVVGVRNSHDKSISASILLGGRVYICSNLDVSAEIKLSRKHSRHIARDLNQLVCRATHALSQFEQDQDRRIAAMQAAQIDDAVAHDLIVRAIDARAISASKISRLLAAWRRPIYPQFAPRTVWSLFNAFTETYKLCSSREQIRKSQALNGLVTGYLGLAA